MLASYPASMVNQKHTDLGIPNRFNLTSSRFSSQALGLDQVPESLLPLLACRESLGLSYAGILVIVLMFFVGELAISRLLYVLRIRDQPY
ncbi:hypothetical protein [Bradyrhizobium sp. CCBAU 53338]|uniref:hypothetical protein n=1 Tax=Bradyrhizobium sp. CCBAU 53338 TaxID=1325111 RepID=UPI00188A87DE|nr:hypothetical protein [Bradyrhizobium sp. CCBAU 53338]